MCTILIFLFLGLAAVASGGSHGLCNEECVPIKDLKRYHALVLKPAPYHPPGENDYVTMFVQLTGPQDTLAIKLIGNSAEGKAFGGYVSGDLSVGHLGKKLISKEYSDKLTDKNPESKVYSFLPIKTLEEEYSVLWTLPGNISERFICIEQWSTSYCW